MFLYFSYHPERQIMKEVIDNSNAAADELKAWQCARRDFLEIQAISLTEAPSSAEIFDLQEDYVELDGQFTVDQLNATLHALTMLRYRMRLWDQEHPRPVVDGGVL